MQIIDLRQVPSRSLEPLFEQEIRHWRDELHWDYRPSVELIRKFIDSKALGGYLVSEYGKPAGYGFYVLEEYKGLIGGLFVSSDFPKEQITQTLVAEMVAALHATPRLARVEAQLMPFGSELDPSFLSKYFRLRSQARRHGALKRATPGTMDRSRLRICGALNSTFLRESRGRRHQRPIPHRSRRHEVSAQHRAPPRLRAISSRSVIPRPARVGRTAGRHGAHLHRF